MAHQAADTPASAASDAAAQQRIVNRLRRAHGQLAAVIAAVEQDGHRRDIVQQLAATSQTIDRAGFLVVSSALQECLAEPDRADASDPEELERLFLSLA